MATESSKSDSKRMNATEEDQSQKEVISENGDCVEEDGEKKNGVMPYRQRNHGPIVIQRGANGYVKWFSLMKGYGFLCVEETGEEVFMHASSIVRAIQRPLVLAENQKVEFDIVIGPKGQEAVTVSGPGGVRIGRVINAPNLPYNAFYNRSNRPQPRMLNNGGRGPRQQNDRRQRQNDQQQHEQVEAVKKDGMEKEEKETEKANDTEKPMQNGKAAKIVKDKMKDEGEEQVKSAKEKLDDNDKDVQSKKEGKGKGNRKGGKSYKERRQLREEREAAKKMESDKVEKNEEQKKDEVDDDQEQTETETGTEKTQESNKKEEEPQSESDGKDEEENMTDEQKTAESKDEQKTAE